MIAASARTSGTSRPNSSTRNRGVCRSLSSRALASARARGSVARRARAVDAEYAFFLAVADDVAARAGVFCFEGEAATVCAAVIAGAEVSINAAAANDTAIFVRRFGFAISKLSGL